MVNYTSFPLAPCYAGETVAAGCIYPPGMITRGHPNNAGKTLTHAPHLTGQFGADYKIHFTGDYSMAVSTNMTYSSPYRRIPTKIPTGCRALTRLLMLPCGSAGWMVEGLNGKWQLL